MDLPIPGSPPTRTREPATKPPPSTRSSSRSPDENRAVVSVPISDRGVVVCSPAQLCWREGLADTGTVGCIFSSTNVFQLLQPGHFPSQPGVSYPHSEQTNMDLGLAMVCISCWTV